MNRLQVFFLICLLAYAASAQKVQVVRTESGILFMQGKDSVLFYQSTNKSQDGAYKRSNYVHPLFSLDGQVLTEDFPTDHLHHRGIFWAWHQLYAGDKRIGDGWEIKDFGWEVVSVDELAANGEEKSIRALVHWKSPLWVDSTGTEKPLVSEQTTIACYPATEEYRAIDIEISLLALEPAMRIGGSEDEKGYGGFSPRVRLADDVVFTSASGVVIPQKLPIQDGNWMDITGSMGKKGAISGVTILCHPDNPGAQNVWILRSKSSMQNAVYPYPGAIPIALSDTDPTVLRYRLLIHEGLEPAILASLYAGYVVESR